MGIPITRLPDLIRSYIDERSAGWSLRTKRLFSMSIRWLVAFLDEREKELDRDSMVQFLSYAVERWSPGTATLHMTHVKSFAAWLYDSGHIDRPIHGRLTVRKRAGQIKVFAFPFDAYYRSIHSYCDVCSHLFTLGYHSGMSLCDSANLRWSEVDLDRGVIIANRRKTGNEFIIPVQNSHLYDHLCALHKKWEASCIRRQRAGAEVSDDELVMPEALAMWKRGTTLQVRLRRALAASKLPQIRWHDLRRAFTSRLIKAGVDPLMVCKMTGHTDTKMVARYATIEPETLIDVFNEAKTKIPDGSAGILGSTSSKALPAARSRRFVQQANDPNHS